ncbi:MAG: hypothetical protein NZZ41_04940 [Candidatus Dojkabacteria bacterium]|nr:hypothetical protein [Candidatus Dojkabacteria bacterium]
MNFLVVNPGSSSVKIKLFDDNLKPILYFHSKQNTLDDCVSIDILYNQTKIVSNFDLNSSSFAELSANIFFDFFQANNLVVDTILYRIVHIGEYSYTRIPITDYNLDSLQKKYLSFAPIHNPLSFNLIDIFRRKFRHIANHYGMLDSAFFMNIPEINYLYAVPYEYYKKFNLRRYGFHGFSHKFVANEICNIYKKPNTKIISCHLGAGSSVSALIDKEAIDTSFGFSPTSNILSSTRCGEIDYAAINYLQNNTKMTSQQINELLNFHSGLLGLSQYSKDMKVLLRDYNTNLNAKRAVDKFVLNVSQYIAKMAVSIKGVDVLAFTGGIGAGSDVIRRMIVENLQFLNIYIDDSKNDGKIDVSYNLNISSKNSKIQVWVIPPNEELQMIKDYLEEIKI